MNASLAASSVSIYSSHLATVADPPLALAVDDQLRALMAPLARLQVR